MSEPPPEDTPSPAEERLLALLVLLRREVDLYGPDVPALMRRVRVQRVLRELLGAAGSLAAAVGEGLSLVLGLPRRRRT